MIHRKALVLFTYILIRDLYNSSWIFQDFHLDLWPQFSLHRYHLQLCHDFKKIQKVKKQGHGELILNEE